MKILLFKENWSSFGVTVPLGLLYLSSYLEKHGHKTIIRDLNKKIVGYQIVDFWSEWEKGIKGISLKKFQTSIVGRKILRVRRIGKNIFIEDIPEPILDIYKEINQTLKDK